MGTQMGADYAIIGGANTVVFTPVIYNGVEPGGL